MDMEELRAIMPELSRLTHRRSSTPRVEALARAHRILRDYADRNQLTEEWADVVLDMLLHREEEAVALSRAA